MAGARVTALRGRVLTFAADPVTARADNSYRSMDDGLVVMADGTITALEILERS